MKWIELSITILRESMNTWSDLFMAFASNGYTEEDVEKYPHKVRITIYGEEGKSEKEFRSEVIRLLEEYQIEYEDLSCKEVTDETWLHSWQQYIEPIEIIPGTIICPSWKTYQKKGNEKVYTIDTKLSFGTGDHPTTVACAELIRDYIGLQEIDTNVDTSNYGLVNNENNLNSHTLGDATSTIEFLRKGVCLDIGTGTGILLYVAHSLGIKNLVGIDIDEDAAKQAQINCEYNNVPATIIHGDLDRDYEGTAHIIVANLTVDPLKILLPIIGNKLVAHGILIISGIIDERYDEILPYINKYWIIDKEIIKGPWHTLGLKPKVNSMSKVK